MVTKRIFHLIVIPDEDLHDCSDSCELHSDGDGKESISLHSVILTLLIII